MSDEHKKNCPTRLIFVLAGFSGACGLAYEVIYSRLFSNYFGDHFVINGIILSAVFMGISFGSWKSSRFIRQLAYIELGIGLYAIGIATLFSFWGFEISGFGQSLVINPLKLVVLLFIPAFFIGTCVPLFTQYISFFGGKNVSAFTGVYALYNFGALLSVIVIEFILLRWWGIRFTAYAVGIVNLFIGGFLLSLGKKNQWNKFRKKKKYKLDRLMMAVLFLASFVSGVFQLYSLRIAALVFGPFRENLAIILVSTMLGITIGSVLSVIKGFSFKKALAATLLGYLFFLLLLPAFISSWSMISESAPDSWYLILKILFLTVYPLFIFTMFGAWVPLIVKYHKNQGSVDMVGPILGISSLANGLGVLFMFLVLYRYLSLLQNGILILILFVVSYAILIGSEENRIRFSGDFLFKMATVGVFVFFIIHFWPEKELLLGYQSISSSKRLKDEKEIFQDFVTYKAFDQSASVISFKDKSRVLVFNGHQSLYFYPDDRKTALREMTMGASPVLFTGEVKQALVFGLGSGITAGATAQLYNQTKIVEINPAMLRIPQHFAYENKNIMEAKNVNIVLDDGMSWLLKDDNTYDAIVNTITKPQYYSASKLYTREFYEIVLSRLNENGVYSGWFSLGIRAKGVSVMLNTMEATFDYCRYFLLSHGYFNFVCGEKPLDYLPVEKVVERTKGSRVMEIFRQSDFRDNFHTIMKGLEIRFGKSFFARSSKKENTLDLPVIEFIAQLRGHGPIYLKLSRAIRKNIQSQKKTGSQDSEEWKKSCYIMAQMSSYRSIAENGIHKGSPFYGLGCLD